jgi:hypothetical protein
MVDSNILDKAVFALALRPTEDASSGWIDMGYYDNMAMANPDDLMWIDSVNDEWLDDFWWQNYMTAIRIRPQGLTYEESLLKSEAASTVVD